MGLVNSAHIHQNFTLYTLLDIYYFSLFPLYQSFENGTLNVHGFSLDTSFFFSFFPTSLGFFLLIALFFTFCYISHLVLCLYERKSNFFFYLPLILFMVSFNILVFPRAQPLGYSYQLLSNIAHFSSSFFASIINTTTFFFHIKNMSFLQDQSLFIYFAFVVLLTIKSGRFGPQIVSTVFLKVPILCPFNGFSQIIKHSFQSLSEGNRICFGRGLPVGDAQSDTFLSNSVIATVTFGNNGSKTSPRIVTW